MSIVLTPAELVDLTGVRQPARQLAILHARGFWRAYRGRTGAVILERAHYEAVSRGETAPKPAPKLRTPALRTA